MVFAGLLGDIGPCAASNAWDRAAYASSSYAEFHALTPILCVSYAFHVCSPKSYGKVVATAATATTAVYCGVSRDRGSAEQLKTFEMIKLLGQMTLWQRLSEPFATSCGELRQIRCMQVESPVACCHE